MRILKFGGKSVATIEKMQKIAKFIKKIYKNDKKIIIIISAMGSRTDELTHLANEFGSENLSKRELAKLLSVGETESSSLFSMLLNSFNIPAKSFSANELEILTYGDYTNARIAYINKTKLENELQKNTVCVIAGFQGINSSGEITTLGRGGSDTTAAAIGAIFEHDIEIYSDFDGIFAGDPRELDYKKLKLANYEQIKNMAKNGAKVLDERAVSLSKDYGIKIFSKSSSLPTKTGSLVCPIESDVISISTINHLSKISIIFSNKNKFNFIIKNVLNSLKDVNFYNFEINNNEISFLVLTANKIQVENVLAKKLNLLKK